MTLGIRGFNPIWSEVDLQGNLFDDTFYLYVLENTIPYAPADVYHDPDLNTVWTQPIQFLGNGTLPVDIYFESEVVYRLEFRQNNGINMPSQADPLIYEVNNYVAGSGGSTPIDTVATTSSNQITNPQFALINFISPYTFTGTNPDPIEIGPGWTLELAGTGTVTITQLPLDDANINPSNAPYALELNLSGWTDDSVILKQRFQQNGMLWADKIVSSAITARLENIPQTITAKLYDSNDTLLGTVLDDTAVDNNWNEFLGYAELDVSTNPDDPPAAYIEYRLYLPSSVDISVTSIQLLVQDTIATPGFDQDSIDRQIDHTFHYYKPLLEFKPIPSYLVGWDFPLNPSQFGTTTPTGNVTLGTIGANKAAYMWDQTIVFQSADNAISSSRSDAGNLVLTIGANTKLALVQYLDYKQAQKILMNNVSVNTVLASSRAVNMTISLWYTDNAALPDVNPSSNLCVVTGLDADGYPTVVAGWNEMLRVNNNQKATFVMPTSLEVQADATNGFSGWLALDQTTVKDQLWFAIVVGTGALQTGDSVEFSSISLVPGDIPTIPAPQTFDEVLRECQYYYEKSYNYDVHPGENTDTGLQYAYNKVTFASPNVTLYLNSFSVVYKVVKRVFSDLTFYTPAGVSAIGDGSVSVGMYRNGAPNGASGNPGDFGVTANYTFTGISQASVFVQCTTTSTLRASYNSGASGAGDEGQIRYHYVADSRLGIM